MSGRQAAPVRIVRLGSVPPWQTQAYYHALAERMAENSPDTILVCRPDTPYVCLGYHQVFESVLDPAECARRNLPVFRRRVGGGATYLDGNQLFYQCIFHHRRLPVDFRAIYARLLAAPVAALRSLGLQAALHEINEIEVNQRRIAGIGGGRIGEACVVVGNLLFDFDFESMAAVWQVPWEAFRQLAAAALRQRITTLWQHQKSLTIEHAEQALLAAFGECLGRPLYYDSLSPAEESAARKVAHKLTAPEFLALHREEGAAPQAMRALKISARAHIQAAEMRLNGYRLRGSFRLAQDVIQEAILESDPPHEWKTVEEHLHGVRFHEWQEQIPAH